MLRTTLVLSVLLAALLALDCGAKEYDIEFSGKGDYEAFCKATELVNTGVALLNKNNIDEAIAKFKSAIQLYPDHPKAHDNLGIAYRKKLQLSLAEGECKRSTELDGKNWKSWRNLATVYYDERKYDAAIAAYRSALAAKPPAVKAAAITQDIQYMLDLKKSSQVGKNNRL